MRLRFFRLRCWWIMCGSIRIETKFSFGDILDRERFRWIVRELMSTTAVMEIGSDLWNARVYAGLSLASELAAGVDRHKTARPSLIDAFTMYRIVARLNRTLDGVIAAFEKAIERHQIAGASASSAEAYRSARDTLLPLISAPMIVLTLQTYFGRGWLLRGSLARLKVNSERLLDMIDWLDAMSAPEEIQAKMNAALEEIARGEVVPLSALR